MAADAHPNSALVAPDHRQEEDGEDKPQPIQDPTPAAKFLQVDAGGLWELGPLPDGNARSSELGKALHEYMTQQWSMHVLLSLYIFY